MAVRLPRPRMTISDRLLQHFDNPAKRLLDLASAAAASVLLWQQHLIRGAGVGIGGPVIASAIVFAFADTAKPRGMSAPRLAMRVIGAIVLWGGAWWTSTWICAAGAALLAFSLVTRAMIETFARGLIHRVTRLYVKTSHKGLSHDVAHNVAN